MERTRTPMHWNVFVDMHACTAYAPVFVSSFFSLPRLPLPLWQACVYELCMETLSGIGYKGFKTLKSIRLRHAAAASKVEESTRLFGNSCENQHGSRRVLRRQLNYKRVSESAPTSAPVSIGTVHL